MKNALVQKDIEIDLTQSHRHYRVFFVGPRWWKSINRVTSCSLGAQQTKIHGKWTFVLTPSFEPKMIVEIPLISWFVSRRYTKREKRSSMWLDYKKRNDEKLKPLGGIDDEQWNINRVN